ncbi:phosphotransferase family protein [Streptomyces endophyticus]|uniref:Phosphotransferase family protein n=1 Tax=Streptomyces endophyticus TaxID=714166 RepID=A0ABU6F2V4_9ACTN|nr:phosphotransferase family protein [Streptomyces endophyticus]MEB8338336.1 phosphotransferase family protein [Streptomyces endophyticus]
MSEPLLEELRARLAELWGGPVTVEALRRLSGGASRDTFSLDATAADGVSHPLILRCDPPVKPSPEVMAREAAVLAAAAEAGVPVPRLVDHGTVLGRAHLLMERVEGETIPRRLLRDERFAAVRPQLARELGRILARIHTIPVASVPDLPEVDPLRQLTDLYRQFDDPRPAVELGLRWLADHRPPTARPACVVHGDFRNGNLMIDESGVLAVLDWELTHIGDPVEDLGWLCVKAWRFGSAEPVGGFAPREELLAGYAEIAGVHPSADELHWWEVYGTLRWAVLCRMQAERFLSGAEQAVEYAVLGRKVCEQEYDVLLALGVTEPGTVPDALAGREDTTAASPHDRPGADALLRAVQTFLAEETAGDPRLRFLSKVAANAVAIARREALLAPAQAEAHARRLAVLGVADDRALAGAIRDGTVAADDPAALEAVRGGVTDKLAVANPAYAGQIAR